MNLFFIVFVTFAHPFFCKKIASLNSPSWMPKPILDAHIFSNTEPFYTVIAHPTKQINDLCVYMKTNCVSYVFIDKENFPRDALDLIYRKFTRNQISGGGKDCLANEYYRKPQIYFQTDFYIGGTFEMYQILASLSFENPMGRNSSTNKLELDSTVKKWATFEDFHCLASMDDEKNYLV
jgi:hypothetical protein